MTLYCFYRILEFSFCSQYIFEANNNAQRIYSYTADKYQAKAEGGSYSYAALY